MCKVIVFARLPQREEKSQNFWTAVRYRDISVWLLSMGEHLLPGKSGSGNLPSASGSGEDEIFISGKRSGYGDRRYPSLCRPKLQRI